MQRHRTLTIINISSQQYLDKVKRWIILFLSCWIMFGNYYAYDNPSALNTLLRVWMPGSLYEYKFSALYTAYSLPNLVLPLLAGGFIDKWGTGPILCFLSLLSCAGQGLFGLGVDQKSWKWMLMGRVVFGIGGESLAVAQARLVSRWFEGKELALAVGLNLSIARLGTVFNNNLSPIIANQYGVARAVWVGFASCLVSGLCTLVCIHVDYMWYCRQSDDVDDSDESDHDLDYVNIRKSRKKKDLWHPAFVLLTMVCFLFYGCMIPYNNIASEYLQSRYYPGQISRANAAMSIPDTLAIFLVPIVGAIVDRWRRKLDVIGLGGACFAIGHWMLGHGRESPVLPLIILGVGYSTMLAFWPCVPNLVPLAGHARAYGTFTCAFNAAVTIIPMAIPVVVSWTPDYSGCGRFFSGLAMIGMAAWAVVCQMNIKYGLGLNSRKMQGLQPIAVMPCVDGFAVDV